MTAEYLILAVITAASALTSVGFSIAAIRVSTDTARTNALYAIARSVPFAVISLVPFVYHHRGWIIAVSTGMVLVQLLDGLIGIRLRDRLKTVGPMVTAVANAVALIWFIN